MQKIPGKKKHAVFEGMKEDQCNKNDKRWNGRTQQRLGQVKLCKPW